MVIPEPFERPNAPSLLEFRQAVELRQKRFAHRLHRLAPHHEFARMEHRQNPAVRRMDWLAPRRPIETPAAGRLNMSCSVASLRRWMSVIDLIWISMFRPRFASPRRPARPKPDLWSVSIPWALSDSSAWIAGSN